MSSYLEHLEAHHLYSAVVRAVAVKAELREVRV
jgi:hypothetical protein